MNDKPTPAPRRNRPAGAKSNRITVKVYTDDPAILTYGDTTGAQVNDWVLVPPIGGRGAPVFGRVVKMGDNGYSGTVVRTIARWEDPNL